MSVSLSDIQPKPFIINIKGVELSCNPLRLSHALILTKIGNVFQNTDDATKETIKQAEQDMDEVIAELIPELQGTQLDVGSIMEVIAQMMDTIEPSDNKELREKGVKFDSDPKAQKIG